MLASCRYCGEFRGDGTPQQLNNHYKTLYHKYNFERKQFNLKPVTEDEFQIYTNKSPSTLMTTNKSSHCTLCRKDFKSEKAYQNHTTTKGHIKMADKELKKSNSSLSKHITISDEDVNNSSDYEDINETENDTTNICINCDYVCEKSQLNEHFLEHHKFVIPHSIEKLNLEEHFMEYYLKITYEYKSCSNCFKPFSRIKHLINHIHDKEHFIPSSNLIDEFINEISTKIDNELYETILRLHQNNHNIDKDQLHLITPNNDKILCHRKLLSKLTPSKDLFIVPKLHIGLKQINELSKIPVDYDDIRNHLGKNIPDNKLKSLVLYELSRNACISSETPFEYLKCDNFKSAALRRQQKYDVNLGIQMNKVHRPLPKKLMFM